MTLILNEIQILNGLDDCYWLVSADRRLTRKGKIEGPRKKVFPIPYLHATISYFGLASYFKDFREYYVADFMQSFIRDNHDCKTLDEFANRFHAALNQEIPSKYIKAYHSGFHFCGFNENKLPHFLHLSNVGDMEGAKYVKIMDSYKPPFADFLGNDAKEKLGWDGIDPKSVQNKAWIYRNGDIISHVYTSNVIDDAMIEIFKLPNFNKITDYKRNADYVRFKFDIIVNIHNNFAKEKTIGRPIDTYILLPGKILEKKKGKWQPVK
jgi:hypothetical protein